MVLYVEDVGHSSLVAHEAEKFRSVRYRGPVTYAACLTSGASPRQISQGTAFGCALLSVAQGFPLASVQITASSYKGSELRTRLTRLYMPNPRSQPQTTTKVAGKYAAKLE